MKIGILADIHEHVENLRSALDKFQTHNVDQVLILGDVFEMGERIDDTIDLLCNMNSECIWGNHELGLCVEPDAETMSKYGERVTDFFRSFKPSIDLEGVHFSHAMPTYEAADAESYYLGEPPWSGDSLSSVFARFPNDIFIIGHYHCWGAWSNKRGFIWDGLTPLAFDAPERYFAIVHGVLYGWCAVLDTETSELTPHYIGSRVDNATNNAMNRSRGIGRL